MGIKLTLEQLKAICPLTSRAILDKYLDPLNKHMSMYEINTLLRVRHFIAQVAHESGDFNYVKEIASGAAYEGRKSLGNTQVGDGKRFKGRGLIQVTGRANYSKCSKALFKDERLIEHPELLETPELSVLSACWFWYSNGLNELADKDDIVKITKRINGGTNGLKERILKYEKAKKSIV